MQTLAGVFARIFMVSLVVASRFSPPRRARARGLMIGVVATIGIGLVGPSDNNKVSVGAAHAAERAWQVRTTISVPSDQKATYEVVELTSKPNGHGFILTKRTGSSGASFSLRECACGTNTFRYLGNGDTEQQARRVQSPPSQFAILIGKSGGMGSISFYVCEHACGRLGSRP